MGAKVFNSFFKDKLIINNHVTLKFRLQNVPEFSDIVCNKVIKYALRSRCRLELRWLSCGGERRECASQGTGRRSGRGEQLCPAELGTWSPCMYCCAIVVRLDYPGFLCFILCCCNVLLLSLTQSLCSCLSWTEALTAGIRSVHWAHPAYVKSSSKRKINHKVFSLNRNYNSV